MKPIRIGSAAILIVTGTICAWFWFTAWDQQSGLMGGGIRTSADLSEQLPVFSAALDVLRVDIFAPSDDPMGVIMRLNGQLWRRTLVGVAVLLAGLSLLLLAKSESKSKRTALIAGRVVIAFLLCCSCLLIWWSWHRSNAGVLIIETERSPNQPSVGMAES